MNNIVEQIHESFSVAEAELLQEVNSILKRDTEKDHDRVSKLKAAGFYNAKPVVNLSPEKVAQAKALKSRIDRYNVIAPQYKFITDEKLDAIIEKYGLVLGEAKLYKEDIPQRNQDDIVGFDFAERAKYEAPYNPLGALGWETKDGDVIKISDMTEGHLSNTYRLLTRGRRSSERSRNMSNFDMRDPFEDAFRTYVPDRSNNRTDLYKFIVAMYYEHVARGDGSNVLKPWEAISSLRESIIEENKPNNQFYIAADIASMDMSEHTLDGNRCVSTQLLGHIKESAESDESALLRQYDPIVLKRVLGGWFIVTAWGNEAKDPDVISQNRN